MWRIWTPHKADCLNSKISEEKKGRKFFKKKAYITWEDNASSSSNSSDSENEEANLCLMANHGDSDSEMTSKSRRSMWYLDNGCSRHMTGDKKKFKNFKRKEQGFVTYGDNNKGKILGTSDVGGGNTLEIKDVLYVEGLCHLWG